MGEREADRLMDGPRARLRRLNVLLLSFNELKPFGGVYREYIS